MKTFESLVIRKKLASFRSVFPHGDNPAVKNIAGVYVDVLNFSKLISTTAISVNPCTHQPTSRLGLYSESVTKMAWKLILLQIGNGTTSYLTQALSKRPPDDARIFLSTLMTTCVSDAEQL